jgi:hypothetical protein
MQTTLVKEGTLNCFVVETMAKIDDHLRSNSCTHDTQLNADVHPAYQMAWENFLVHGDDTERFE